MSDNRDFSLKRFPWLRSGFDLEGYVGALAAWLVGLLLGALWDPLFWIGFVGAVVILFATRTAERTPPVGTDLLVTPIDGIVVDIARAAPPAELRLRDGDWTRVRVSVGPTKTNGVYAPIDGEIDHIILESGDPAAFAAMSVDRPGLAVAYVSLESGSRATGMRLATGGLGPRLEVRSEAGDAVRLGRNIGTMRLGGWCEIYVQGDADIGVIEGQTLIGSETVLARFGDDVAARPFEPREEDVATETLAAPVLTPEPVAAAVADEVEATHDDVAPTPDVEAEADIFDNSSDIEPVADDVTVTPIAEDAPRPEMDEEDALTLEKIAGRVAAVEAGEDASNETGENVSDMLKRLRKEAREAYRDED